MYKVAICFYGQPRFYKQVLPIWNKIIEELDADVFLHTWYGQERTKNFVDVNELISDFQPKEFKVSNPHKFMDIIPNDAKFQNQSFHAMQQAYSINQSILLLEQYEKDLHQKYEIIIRCRMDIEITNPDNFIEYVKNYTGNKLAVCGKCWAGSRMFDDNIMVGNAGVLKNLFKDYFNYTILYIHKTKIIPGGENNLFQFINYNQVYDLIQRDEAINFELLYMKPGEFIMNQND